MNGDNMKGNNSVLYFSLIHPGHSASPGQLQLRRRHRDAMKGGLPLGEERVLIRVRWGLGQSLQRTRTLPWESKKTSKTEGSRGHSRNSRLCLGVRPC